MQMAVSSTLLVALHGFGTILLPPRDLLSDHDNYRMT
jgi:hypothetical protein